MAGELTLEGKIPRAVIYRRRYGYNAEPGHLVVDLTQGDPPAALITNRSGSSLSVDLVDDLVNEVIQVPRSRLPRTSEEWSSLRRIGLRRGIPLPNDDSLVLVFIDGARGVQRYDAAVDETAVGDAADTRIYVSGGSGPDIIIER